MKKLALLFACSLLLGACGKKLSNNSPADAAKEYYTFLIQNRYEDYVKAMLSMDTAPQDYRQRMVTLVKQYVAREKEESGGLKSVDVDTVRVGGNGRTANAFLNVKYGNGSTESVVLPLVEDKGVWRMQ